MNFSLADNYFLKALDYYPYNLELSSENLNYALSYDGEHAQANCLMGRMYMEIIKDYDAARAHFELAIANDPAYVDSYKFLSLLLIWMNEFEQAKKVINYAQNVRGMDRCIMLHRQALIYEARGQFYQAQNTLRLALKVALNNHSREYLKAEMERVQSKLKSRKKRHKNLSKVLKLIFLYVFGRW